MSLSSASGSSFIDSVARKQPLFNADNYDDVIKTTRTGPQTAAKAQSDVASAKALFPNAEVVGSTLDAFVKGLVAHGTSSLPVITSEIGDTWIYGLQADPKKTKSVRLLLRERAAAVAETPSLASDPSFRNMSRWLFKLTEHTWGETHGRYDHFGVYVCINTLGTLMVLRSLPLAPSREPRC